MKNVQFLAFRYITSAEFFNMYKPLGTEAGGGGQKYIDFKTPHISVESWREFFNGVTGMQETQVANGPKWDSPIYSIGIPAQEGRQNFYMYQRRAASVCIPRQHIHSGGANRVLAWHPINGFPEPLDPTNRNQLPAGLVIYLVRTYDQEIWAGWFRNAVNFPSPFRDDNARELLQEMLRTSTPGVVGMLQFEEGVLWIDENDPRIPFLSMQAVPAIPRPRPAPGPTPRPQPTPGPRRPRRSYPQHQRTEDEIADSLFGEDVDFEVEEPATREIVTRVRQRNARAVQALKELYAYRCQITDTRYTFIKRDGNYYTEAHHLIPLGDGGADNPYNIIIVSPLIHRMLHYADVSEINFAQIAEQEDGSATLEITINGEPYTIKWHPRHAERVLHYQNL
ncbi:MAG: hypothetical protein ACLPT6_12195 [Desulfobaccales bacterium]